MILVPFYINFKKAFVLFFINKIQKIQKKLQYREIAKNAVFLLKMLTSVKTYKDNLIFLSIFKAT